ncbi:MAG: hypothetical protein ACM3VX_09800 [Bacteroidota bacterium]
MSTAVEAGSVLVRIRASIGEFKATLQDAKRELRGLSDSFKAQAEGFRTLALGAGALTTALGLVAKGSVQAAADMETYHNTLKTVLKSEKEATEYLEWAKDFAASTPFEIPQIVEATVKLKAYGMEAKSMMTDVGDMAAVMGRNIIDAVEAVADAANGEIERIREFGITKDMIVAQAREMGKEIVNTQGQIIDRQEFLNSLLALMKDRFAGGMRDMMESQKGIWSNLMDAVGGVQRSLGESLLPTVERVELKLTDAAKAAGKWVGENKTLAASLVITATAATGLTAAAGLLGLALPPIAAGFKLLADGLFSIKLAAAAVSGGWATFGQAIGMMAGSFAPFLIGGIILAGLSAIIGLIGKIRHEAALAAKDLSQIDDIKEAQERVQLSEKRLAQAREYARIAREMSVGRYKITTPLEQDAQVKAAERQLELDKKHLETLKQKTEEQKKSNEQAQQQVQHTRTAADVMKDLEKALASAETKERLLGNAFNLNEAKAKAFESALSELADMGLKPTDERLQGIAQRLKSVTAQMEAQSRAAEQLRKAWEKAYEGKKVFDLLKGEGAALSPETGEFFLGWTEEEVARYKAGQENEAFKGDLADAGGAKQTAAEIMGSVDQAIVDYVHDSVIPAIEDANAREGLALGVVETVKRLREQYAAENETTAQDVEAAKESPTPEGFGGFRLLDEALSNNARSLADAAIIVEESAEQTAMGFERIKQAAAGIGSAIKEQLGSAVSWLGGLLKGGLGGAFAALLEKTQAFKNLIVILAKVAQPLIDLLDAILMPILKFIAGVWNAIINALAGIDIFGWHPFGGLRKYVIKFDENGDVVGDTEGTGSDSSSGNSGTQISEITGPTRDLLVGLLKPLDQLPNFFGRLLEVNTEIRDILRAGLGVSGAQMQLAAAGAGGGDFHIDNLTVTATFADTSSLDRFTRMLAEAASNLTKGSGGR